MQIDAEKLVEEITGRALSLREAYGRQLAKESSLNPILQNARGQMKAYMEVLDIVKKLSGC